MRLTPSVVSTAARPLLALAVALGAVAWPAAARAQEPGIALGRFVPAPAGDHFFGVPSPHAGEHQVPHVMLLTDYAHNPLVYMRELPDGEQDADAIVSHQLYMHLNGSVGLYERLAVNLDVPIALSQSGSDPVANGTTYVSPDSAQFGDLRVGFRARLFGEYSDAVQLAVGGYLWFPTGPSDEGDYTGNGTVRGLPQGIAGGIHGPFVWSLVTGPEVRSEQSYGGVVQSSMWHWALAAGYLVGAQDEVQLGAETTFAVDMTDVDERNTNAEGMVTAKWRFTDYLRAGMGIGPGFSSGIGTPDMRWVASFAYSPVVRHVGDQDLDGINDGDDACPNRFGPPRDDPAEHGCPDRDADGIIDRADACPDDKGAANDDPREHGCPAPADSDGDGIADGDDACPNRKGVRSDDPKKHGCPAVTDRDGDGIVDAWDACPDEKGVYSGDPQRNGCPLGKDSDGDGVLDSDDACPDTPGVRQADPTANGCPPDRDGDGILDAEDACIDQKGPKSDDPAKHGCPLVMVTKGEIKILQQVQFDLGKATIKPESGKLLDEIAQVLRDNPSLLLVEVQGHTDSTGGRFHNMVLSGNRAKAVMDALITRKIDAKRLTSKGYGPDRPIADNLTDAGRKKNRRVQFKILKRK